MARELVAGAKAPAFILPRDGGGKVSLKDFKWQQSRPLFLSQGGYAGMHQRSDRVLRLRVSLPKPIRRFSGLGGPGGMRR